jgi:fructose-1-phosphate kinase PfkB-like protein
VVGGKGNNVARALTRLGRSARPVTFLGGPIGEYCAALLGRDDGLDPLVTRTTAPTRIILTVRTAATPDQTAFFDPDPSITSCEAESLVHQVDAALAAGGIEALTLSGSSPSPATHGVYSDLIALARSRKVPVFLDTYGPALAAIWGFWPDAIQLNRREAAAHLRVPVATDADVARLIADWSRHGVSCGIVTDGDKPVYAHISGQTYRAIPPRIGAVNPIGSGDCLLAGLVDARLAGQTPESVLRHAVACGVANALVWDAGAIDSAEVARQESAIVIEPMPSR